MEGVISKTLLKDAASLYVGRGLNLFIGLFSTFFYGVIFPASGIAQISLFEMLVNFAISLGFTWTTTGLVRFGKSEYTQSGSISKTSSIRTLILVPSFAAVLVLAYVFMEEIYDYVGLEAGAIVLLLVVNIVLLAIHEHVTYLQTTTEEHTKNVIYYLGLGITKCLILFLLYLKIVPATVTVYLSMTIIGLLLLLIARLPYVNKKSYRPFIQPDREEVVKYVKYCAPQILGFAGIFIINWIDLFFLRKYCTFEEIGSYQFLYSIFLKLASFSIILNTLFFPRIMYWKEENSEKIRTYISKAPIAVMSIIFVLVAIFIVLYLNIFPLLFGEKFSGSYSSFNILLTSLPFYFSSYLFIPLLNSYDKVKEIQFINIICSMTNLIIDYAFIPKYGVIAAANATFIAYFVQFIIMRNISFKIINTDKKYTFQYLFIFVAVFTFNLHNTILHFGK
jgi:O-antigen/teichoic acid export membrane protein